ncbi:MAG: hypothetical protein ACYCQI_03620 [Gammaproteobacteria bacterium]
MDKINLFVFFLPVAIFLFWGVVGYATLGLLNIQYKSLQNILLAPVIGFAITLLFTFTFNQIGMPVNNFSTILTIILLCVSSTLLWWQKPSFPFKSYLPFAALLLLALCLIGYPLLKYGFNWISYSNPDEGFYCLGATRLLYHGFFEIPNTTDLLKGSDYSLFWWFLHVPFMHRAGSELLLAWLSGLMKIAPYEIYMPLILSLHLTLISTTGAMVYQASSSRKISFAVCLLLTFSALAALGTLYQLIAQVGGLTLLIASCVLLFQICNQQQASRPLYQSLLIAIVVSALFVYYPEIAPFLVLGFLLAFIIGMLKKWKPDYTFFAILGLCIVFGSIILNSYWINAISFMLNCSLSHVGYLSSKQAELGSLFPYLLLPTGLANLLGFQNISAFPKEPWLSISILTSFPLFIGMIIMAVKQTYTRFTPAIMTLIMIIMGFELFHLKNGFGLFKLAMYIQPFLLSVLGIGLFSLFKRNVMPYVIIAMFAFINFNIQYTYVKSSYGDVGSPFVELSNASKSHLFQEINQLLHQIPFSSAIAFDTPNAIIVDIVATYFHNRKSSFHSDVYFCNAKKLYSTNNIFKFFMPSYYKAAEKLDRDLDSLSTKATFVVHDPTNPSLTNSFVVPIAKLTPDTSFLMSTSLREIFNHRKYKEKPDSNFEISAMKNVNNYLIFINSDLGQHYLDGYADAISIYNFEKDLLYKDRSMAAVERYLLFRPVNPSPKIRLELNMTTTLNGDSDNSLPPAAIIGEKRILLPMVGRGSARVFSPPFNPQLINYTPYFMLDMGRVGKKFSDNRSGLLNLYGNNISLDRRLLVGFLRDISLVSEEEYNKLKPPSVLSKFPDDLANPDLEYSGIYEDGWISEHSYFNLTQPKDAKLVIKGELLKMNGPSPSSELVVSIDNHKLFSKEIYPGYFIIKLNVANNPGRHNIALHFSKVVSLPRGDNRPVSAKIESLGFEKVTT